MTVAACCASLLTLLAVLGWRVLTPGSGLEQDSAPCGTSCENDTNPGKKPGWGFERTVLY